MSPRIAAPRPWVKICGVTSAEDAELAVALGAAMIGVNFWPLSRRRVELAAARDIVAAVAGRAPVVGVFVNEDPDRIEDLVARVGLDFVQLHGDEPDEVVARFASRALRVLRADARGDAETSARDTAEVSGLSLPGEPLVSKQKCIALLIDGPSGARYGGTGAAWNWSLARPVVEAAPVPVLVAGGIRPENALRALSISSAAGVDVASGVEASPGIKDADKMKRLFEEVARART